MTVESLARALHEAGRAAVLANKVHKKDGAPLGAIKFAEWDELSEDAKEGRRIQIRHLLGEYYIIPRKLVEGWGRDIDGRTLADFNMLQKYIIEGVYI